MFIATWIDRSNLKPQTSTGLYQHVLALRWICLHGIPFAETKNDIYFYQVGAVLVWVRLVIFEMGKVDWAAMFSLFSHSQVSIKATWIPSALSWD